MSELLATFPVVITIPVAWGEMDAYGHVNNSVYFRYIESARIKYLSEVGWDEYELEKDELKVVLPVLGEVKASGLTLSD